MLVKPLKQLMPTSKKVKRVWNQIKAFENVLELKEGTTAS
jgi:hypothetical protein